MRWKLEVGEAPWSRRDSAGEVCFDGRMWILGGYTPRRVNDIWSSENGIEWQQVTEHAPWPERNLPGCVVFDDKIWIMGGVDASGNKSLADVWCSSDGERWELVSEIPLGAQGRPRLPFIRGQDLDDGWT